MSIKTHIVIINTFIVLTVGCAQRKSALDYTDVPKSGSEKPHKLEYVEPQKPQIKYYSPSISQKEAETEAKKWLQRTLEVEAPSIAYDGREPAIQVEWETLIKEPEEVYRLKAVVSIIDMVNTILPQFTCPYPHRRRPYEFVFIKGSLKTVNSIEPMQWTLNLGNGCVSRISGRDVSSNVHPNYLIGIRDHGGFKEIPANQDK